ncbi:MAG: ATP-binding protein [Polyangiaceae bacterium]|nr:ATP-binding protein [Polyangiaceae bacterium]
MTIQAFEFEDKVREWKLERVKFGPFNLLVGMSGVGKTLILDSLRRVSKAVIEGARRVPGCAWTMEIAIDGKRYVWSAATSRPSASVGAFYMLDDMLEEDGEIDASYEDICFVEESVTREDGSVLFNRCDDDLVLRDRPMPSLKKTESLISLLNEDEEIKPIFRAMRRFLVSNAHALTRTYFPYDTRRFERAESKFKTLDDLRDASNLSVMAKMLIMQNRFPDDFKKVVSQYQAIFEQIEEVKVGKLSEFDPAAEGPDIPAEWIAVALRERGVPRLLVHHRISSGMIRTLMHLFELALAPAGTVVLIDEFENSLGVNCLSQVTDHLLERSGDLQFLITSHHPYIINNVPIRDWLVVTRHGCTVKVLDASQLPALNTKSHQDKFTLLTNLREYERGVA